MLTPKLQGKKIVIDGRFLAAHRGGISRYTRELVRHLLELKLGIKLFLIVRHDEPLDPEFKEVINQSAEKIEVIATHASHYSLKEQTELYKLLNSLEADLVHFTNFNHPIRYRRPFVVTVHDLTLHQFTASKSPLKQKAYRYIMKHAVEQSQRIFTVSKFVKHDIVKHYGVPSTKIAVTYNGIDTERFRPISNSKTLQDVSKKYHITKPFILHVGQIMVNKNIDRLVEAFALVDQDPKYHGQYQLAIVGQPKKLEDLRAKADRLGVGKDVIFTGFVDDTDLPALYNAAHLFAFPSLSEGFGIPPLEAMACGTPVVASNATSIPEVLGHAALFFDPHDTEAIARALIRGLTDVALREDLRRRGPQQASLYSWSELATETAAGYALAL